MVRLQEEEKKSGRGNIIPPRMRVKLQFQGKVQNGA